MFDEAQEHGSNRPSVAIESREASLDRPHAGHAGNEQEVFPKLVVVAQGVRQSVAEQDRPSPATHALDADTVAAVRRAAPVHDVSVAACVGRLGPTHAADLAHPPARGCNDHEFGFDHGSVASCVLSA